MKKLPPLQKVYEAWSAVADRRVASDALEAPEGHARVASSDGAKSYTVSWRAGDNGATTYSSNDNATYWQGYAGYPLVAVLMEQGRLTLDRDAAEQFAQVNWTELNERCKRDYAKAAALVISERGLDEERVEAAARTVIAELESLDIVVRRGSLKPPKASKGAPSVG